jgi:acyl-CoA synthetase (AMP-forming)/AMP-acid ligase II
MRLQSVRAFINCSEPCQPETFRRFLEAFANLGVRPDMLQVCYAMAEITFAATQHPLTLPNRVRAFDREALVEQSYTQAPRVGKPIIELLSAGVPITGVEVEIRNKHGDTLPDGVVGEICLRAPFLFSGYFRMPDQTASRLNEGWYQTRDRGFFQDQELYVLGRLDDLLILNGRNYHAAEIEGLLNQITGLKPGRAAAFATANEMRGTSELVIVAETDNSSYIDAPILRHAIREAIFQGIGIYPAEVTVVPPGWLVKTSSGKIARGANAMKHLNSKPIATGKI